MKPGTFLIQPSPPERGGVYEREKEEERRQGVRERASEKMKPGDAFESWSLPSRMASSGCTPR